jgi:drug/metabolite transporter (DMT)-like permease
MKIQMTSIKADLLLLIIAMIYGSGYVVTKYVIAATSPIQFLSYRFFISAAFSIIFFRKKLLHANQTDWIAGSLMGVFLTAAMLIQTVGLQYTSVGKAVFIASAFVVMVPFFYWFVSKEKPKIKIVVASFMMLFGLGLLSINTNELSGLNKGDILVLMSAVSFAMHTTVIGLYAPKKDPFLLTGIQFIVSGILFIIISLFDSNRQPVAIHLVPIILYSAIIVTFASSLAQVIAQKYTPPSHAAIIINLEVVFGTLVAIMFLGESYNSIMTLAFIVIFIAVLVAEVNLKDLKKIEEC